MKILFINEEQEFLNQVKKHEGIGFGRMMQIVSFAYHEFAPIEAFVSGECFGMLPPEDRKVYEKTKESDPLNYSIIEKRTDKEYADRVEENYKGMSGCDDCIENGKKIKKELNQPKAGL